MKPRLLLYLLILIGMNACVPNSKLIYMQNKAGNSTAEFDSRYTRFDYKIQINDILYVSVRSYDEKATSVFNPPQSNVFNYVIAGGAGFFFIGYTIDEKGNIELPVIGNVKVLGLTMEEAKDVIQLEVNKFFVNSFVNVKLNGVTFSMLGEVNRPGKYTQYETQITIFEAIATGGDLTVVANRSKVSLLRQYPEGTKIHYLDLLDKDIINSPYYFIQPNDIIYVEPMKVRELGTGITGFQTFQSVVAVLSLLFLVLNFSNGL